MPDDARPAAAIDPGVMKGVIPYVLMPGRAQEAAGFYAEAFGAEDIGRLPMPDDPSRMMHLQLVINGGAFMMSDIDAGPPGAAPIHGHLQLVVRDGQAWWDRAVAAGCRVIDAYGRKPWGDDWGLLVDPFGVRWAILEPGLPPTP
jgi:PhnB protein